MRGIGGKRPQSDLIYLIFKTKRNEPVSIQKSKPRL